MANLGSPAEIGPAPALRLMVRDSVAEIQHWLQPAERRLDPESVRNARRRLKRVRAASRLLRLADPANARELNAACREAGRALSDARDADAAWAMAARLCALEQDPVARAAFRALSEPVLAETARPDPDLNAARQALSSAADAAQRLPKRRKARKAVRAGLSRIDARERAAYAAALAAGEDEEPRHEWRKRLKDRLFAIRVLRDVAVLDRAEERRRAKRLGALLGEDRDMLLVVDQLRDGALDDARLIGAALASLSRRRERVQSEAARLGAELTD